MIREEEVYKIGMITRTHGVRGEVAMQFTDDVWDRVEADYLFLRLDGLLVPFFLEEWRFRSDTTALLKFDGVDDANAASGIVGAEVLFPKALTPEDVDEEELTWQHFTGFEVWQLGPDADAGKARLLGTVDCVQDQTANVLLEIATPQGGSILIPAHEDFVLNADHQLRHLYVDVPDELLTLNDS
ncbi:MAG: ribosome maturation factor RimM [Bacteroidales bacterium]|nr:ribosome maturation factor RimM [Bacteroidales bacterium]